MNLPRIIVDVDLFCPHCGARHVDAERNGEKWHRRAHTTHRCQGCGQDFDVYVSGKAAPEEKYSPLTQTFNINIEPEADFFGEMPAPKAKKTTKATKQAKRSSRR